MGQKRKNDKNDQDYVSPSKKCASGKENISNDNKKKCVKNNSKTIINKSMVKSNNNMEVVSNKSTLAKKLSDKRKNIQDDKSSTIDYVNDPKASIDINLNHDITLVK